MAMTFPGYDHYDGLSRSLSRRGSLSYGQYPYDQGLGMYGDPMMTSPMPGEYPHPSYPIYAPTASGHPMNQYYDDSAIRDGYYDDLSLQRSASRMSHHYPRHRRHSTVSFAGRPHALDDYSLSRRPGTLNIKFKKKGSFLAGISLAEAQSHTRLTSNDSYSLYDLHADRRGTIHLRVRWAGYTPMTYEIPLDTYDGRISLSTLARRVSRACVHYLQANVIPIAWDRVELHHLEEVAYGVWQPMLAAR